MKHNIWKTALGGAVFGAFIYPTICGVAETNPAVTDTGIPQEYIQYCVQAGQTYGVCPELLEAVIEAESGGNPDAVGQAGEIGLMQIYPEYHLDRAWRLGVYDLFEPLGNILVGADYLAGLFLEYQDAGTALMVYNGTEDAVCCGENGDYTEYAQGILKRAEYLERLHEK